MGAVLVDHAGSAEFLSLRVLHIAQAEEQGDRLTGLQAEVELLGGDGLPAVGNAPGAAAAEDRFRFRRAAVDAQEGVPLGVKAVGLPVAPEERIVVPPLPVLGLVIDGPGLQLHLAGGVVALEVGAVVHSVPEAELHIGEEAEGLDCLALVGKGEADQQAVVPLGDQQFLPGGKAVLCALQDGIAQAVAAEVAVQRRLAGLPARVPDRIAIFNIEAEAFGIQGGVVVAVAGEAAQAGVPVKGVAAGGVGAEGEEGFVPQVIDPGQGRPGRGDHILPTGVVKVAVFHKEAPLVPLMNEKESGKWYKNFRHYNV